MSSVDDIVINEGSSTIRIENLKKIIRQMEKAGADAQDMKDLMYEVGTLVVNGAAGLVPVRSGRLAGNIRASKAKTKAIVRAGGARVPYAGVIHYGWPAHNIVANEFLDKAREDRKQQIVSTISDGIDDILRKVDLV